MASSTDQNIKIKLCQKYQRQPNSCHGCNDLHLCRDYILEKTCSQFDSSGFCDRSHSLWTYQNIRVLKTHRVDSNENLLIFVERALRIHENIMKKSCIDQDSPKPDDTYRYLLGGRQHLYEIALALGPARHSLNKRNGQDILPSGYGKPVSKQEQAMIQDKLNRLSVVCCSRYEIPLSQPIDQLLVLTCAAKRLLEQQADRFAIYSEGKFQKLEIEVIQTADSLPALPDRRSSSMMSPREDISSRIHIIHNDIVQVKVDVLVCVITSGTLLENVLKKAGQQIESEFDEHSQTSNPILLKGDRTSAKNILFVSWETRLDHLNDDQKRKSLTSLIEQCIFYAHRSHLSSISFPLIGAGKLGLAPTTAFRWMLEGAIDACQLFPLQVLFVFQPNGVINDTLAKIYHEVIRSSCIARRSTINKNIIHRNIFGVKLFLSCPKGEENSLSTSIQRSIRALQSVETIPLGRICQSLLDPIDLLLDRCLEYYVLPKIDFFNRTLTLTGDKDSCSQLMANLLRKAWQPAEYYLVSDDSKKRNERKLSIRHCLKINEAITSQQEEIKLTDENETTLHIDLKKRTVRKRDSVFLRLIEAAIPNASLISNDLKTPLINLVPRRNYSNLDWLTIFERSMPRSQWKIVKIQKINNLLLQAHFSASQGKSEIFAFCACAPSYVQSVIHYGISKGKSNRQLSSDAFLSHVHGGRRDFDGRYYMFMVLLSKETLTKIEQRSDSDDSDLVLPQFLITYRRQHEI